ncbi:predicted protein [Uncinocarpus reesii 1704]|uniref:Uncharacterized protein n=1 Tax=Uncinocarpus reesii (strain UAMH 1704) TaxID=336963 RepID=C4JTB7_UNCRE|nr:uncharacterized protein UREG_05706 [Uncinocarpus reesii 1704]EEP80864.1 predicted protein [Uncinocarpus reesii 1704]
MANGSSQVSFSSSTYLQHAEYIGNVTPTQHAWENIVSSLNVEAERLPNQGV